MTAKIDLIAKLTALMPECAREIIKIMREYDVQTAQVYDRSNLPRRVEAFLAAKRIDGCRGYKEKALVEFLVSSGCRVSEVAGLRVDDIDWRDRKCKVIGKGNKERTVYFSVRAKLMLQLYIAERRGGEALFASSRAPYEPLTDRGIEKMISKLGKRIGMERPLYPHLMRHTFASHALNCGMELTIIQHLLGHSDPKTTLIYAEIDPIRVQYEYNRMIC